MISIEPGTIFPITRQLADPTDTTTYYVRAFVRNAQSDVLLKTVNLTDKGDQRFRGEWEVPYSAGPDYYITVETRVYTDSGYTTEYADYERMEEKFAVGPKAFGGGGGGGSDVNYKKIREIVREEVANYEKPEKIDLSPVLTAIKTIESEVKNIKFPDYPEFPKIEFPKQKEVNFAPLLKELSDLKKTVSILENSDLSPIISYLHSLEDIVKDKKNFDEIREDIKLLRGFLDNFIKIDKQQKLKTIKGFISDLGEAGSLEDKPLKRKPFIG